MNVSNWTGWLTGLAIAGLGMFFSPATFGQSFGPPQRVETSFAPGDRLAQAPTMNDYQRLVERLNAAEQRIQDLSERESRLERLPSISDTKRIYADGNPHLPSVEQRLYSLEQVAGKEDTGPHYPNFRLSGFFHLDSGFFSQDAGNQAALGDIQDGVGFRRARLQGVGSVGEFTNYSIEFDFATAGRPSFMDVWGEQTYIPFLGNVRIGQYRQPFCMDALTSIRQLTFLERSLPFQAFVPFRRVGIMAYDRSEDELWSWAYGVYRTGGFNNAPLGDSRFATDIADDGGFSFSGRATHLLHYDEPAQGRYLLHIGGGYNYSRISGGTANGNSYQARAIPEFFVGDPAGGGLTSAGTPFFADTGRLTADQFHLFGLELAGQYGPAHFQAEYMGTVVDQIGASSVYYDGAYVQFGYFLTGEHRSYNTMFGVFDRVTPFTDFFSLGRKSGFCGWGAWEVAFRWSYVNLNNPNAVPAVVANVVPANPNPGRLNDTTLGVNWYWNAYSKVQFNWIHCFLDNAALGNSDCDIYCARFEVDF